MKSYGAVVVSWDFSHGKDTGVLIVGKQENGRMEIVNAFQGPEAFELWKRLTIQAKKES